MHGQTKMAAFKRRPLFDLGDVAARTGCQTSAHTAAKYTLKSAVCTLLQTDTAALTWQQPHFKQIHIYCLLKSKGVEDA